MKAYFVNDYSEIAHELVWERLTHLQNQRFIGYGLDSVTEAASETIRKLLRNEEAEVYFLAGGTLTNKTIISSLLRPHEAVIAVETGHINVHETGAIEASGHKILTTPGVHGKLQVDEVLEVLSSHQDPHKVKPRMLYISNTTELGTVYKKAELEALADICKQNNLLLFMDGARLGQALVSAENDLDLADISQLCDVFYIGGTKLACPFGEAVVFPKPKWAEDFYYLIKNHGAMLAKGFVPAASLGRVLQSLESGEDTDRIEETLYYHLAGISYRQAMALAEGFLQRGLSLAYPAQSNQVFVHMNEAQRDKLMQQNVKFENEAGDICRFVTTYSTSDEEVAYVISLL